WPRAGSRAGRRTRAAAAAPAPPRAAAIRPRRPGRRSRCGRRGGGPRAPRPPRRCGDGRAGAGALVAAPSGPTVSPRLLAERVQGVAAWLAGRGFGPGDVLALWVPNLPQWAGVALGGMAAGGAVTGARPGCTERGGARPAA